LFKKLIAAVALVPLLATAQQFDLVIRNGRITDGVYWSSLKWREGAFRS
jgi:hypothetical protein